MTRLQSAIAIISFIRKEPSPPLARFHALLVMLNAPEPLTRTEISKGMDDPTNQNGTFDSMHRQELIESIATPHRRASLWQLTNKGKAEAARILAATRDTGIPACYSPS